MASVCTRVVIMCTVSKSGIFIWNPGRATRLNFEKRSTMARFAVFTVKNDPTKTMSTNIPATTIANIPTSTLESCTLTPCAFPAIRRGHKDTASQLVVETAILWEPGDRLFEKLRVKPGNVLRPSTTLWALISRLTWYRAEEL